MPDRCREMLAASLDELFGHAAFVVVFAAHNAQESGCVAVAVERVSPRLELVEESADFRSVKRSSNMRCSVARWRARPDAACTGKIVFWPQ